MGAIDTMAGGDDSKNDMISKQGRLEMERGLAKMKGNPIATPASGQNALSSGPHQGGPTGIPPNYAVPDQSNFDAKRQTTGSCELETF